MTIQWMDNGGIVVDDLKAATSFFIELGLELEGEAVVEGPGVDRIVARRRTHGAEVLGEVEQYEGRYRLCHVRGPEGTIVGLAEQRS